VATRLGYSLSSSRGFAPLDEGQAGIDRRRRTVFRRAEWSAWIRRDLKAVEFLRFGAHIALNRSPNMPQQAQYPRVGPSLSSLRSNVIRWRIRGFPRETAILRNAWSASKRWTSGTRFLSTSSFIGLKIP